MIASNVSRKVKKITKPQLSANLKGIKNAICTGNRIKPEMIGELFLVEEGYNNYRINAIANRKYSFHFAIFESYAKDETKPKARVSDDNSAIEITNLAFKEE